MDSDSQFRDVELDKLFGFVERGVDVADSDPPVPGVTVGIRPGEVFTLRGEGYQHLHDLTEAIGRPADEGGPSTQEAQSHLLTACRRFLESGAPEAIAWLRATLAAPLRTWTIIRPTTIFQMADQVTIGGCRIQLHGPSWLVRAFPTWNARSAFAHIKPVSRTAASSAA